MSYERELPCCAKVRREQEAKEMTEEELEERLNHSYQVGVSSGLSQAAGLLMKGGVELFKLEHHDGRAKEFRQISVELDKLAKAAHPRNKK